MKRETAHKAFMNRQRRKAIEYLEANATHRVYQLKKNGTRYARPHEGLSGQVLFTEQDAQDEAARMMALNPGKTFVVV